MADYEKDKYAKLSDKINGVETSTNNTNSEMRLLGICSRDLPSSVCDTIASVVRNKGIPVEVGVKQNAVVRPSLKFSNGKIVGGSISITIKFD